MRIDKRLPARPGTRRRICFDLDEHRSDGHALGIGIRLGVVVLAGQERQPGVVLMAEDRGVGRGNDLIRAHLVDVSLTREVDDHLVAPFQVD